MGKSTGFKEYARELPATRKVVERVQDFKELYEDFPEKKTTEQATRCMDCGIPFCHSGCPLGNKIPDFNDAIYQDDWKTAYDILRSTNNFPEFTGRICPAPCEGSCVLGINNNPVSIELIEKSIAEKAWEMGWIKANPPTNRSGKKIAIVGSGPAGLAAADELNCKGHLVTVFERSDQIGGLLIYGIPDFKLDKNVVRRRLKVLEDEGVIFKTNANVGDNIPAKELLDDFDAVVLTGGSTIPRDLPIEGRTLKGVYYAMDFLTQQNRRVSNLPVSKTNDLWATDKNVIVIGGGDTGSDCIGTCARHGAKNVTQIEIMDKPPEGRAFDNPWPEWPAVLRTSTSHEDSKAERKWSLMTKSFEGNDGQLTGLKVVNIEWKDKKFEEVEGTENIIPCDMVLLAAGFLHPQKEGLLDQLGVALDDRGNVKTENFKTSIPKVFAAGDMRRGQSLVVWAIAEGRKVAAVINSALV